MMRLRIVLGAVVLAAIAMPGGPARAADVHVGINIGPPPPPPIVLQAPPELVVVPQSPVYYAPSLPYNFFYYGGAYYVFDSGHWFTSGTVHGPWAYVQVSRVPRPILAVPVRYYRVPPGHLKRHGPPRGHGHGHGKGHKHH